MFQEKQPENKKRSHRLLCNSFLVIPFGFEPKTYCLEGSCSIQLSYETIETKMSNGECLCSHPTLLIFFRRGGRIRTYDLHIPNVARYRATLHPESCNYR